jgi:hypothetical protein
VRGANTRPVHRRYLCARRVISGPARRPPRTRRATLRGGGSGGV